MKLIFCIDDNNGMLFNNRRQSMDSLLRKRVFDIVGDKKLYMSLYSAKQFADEGEFIADDDFINLACDSDYCFVEDTDVLFDRCSEIIIYKWNRIYPADSYFEFDLETNGYKCVSSTDFVGSSHKKITEQIYLKK